jgi:hypothetical protein
MARAFRLPWRRLEDLDGRSERTLRAIHARLLERMATTASEAKPSRAKPS